MKASTLTVAARIIGCVCMVGAMMLMTQIAVDLLHFGNPNTTNSTRWSSESIEFFTIHHSHQFSNKDTRLLAVGAYAMFYGACSVVLVYATYTGQRLLTLPWLLAEGSCVVCEASSLYHYYVGERKDASRLNVAGAVLCLSVAIAMWGIVFEAQLYWKREFAAASPPPPPAPPAYSAAQQHTLEQPRNAGTPTPTRRPKTLVV